MLGIEDFITDEWYPGFAPSFGHSPYIVEPFRSFSAADKDRFWFLDFHWPRGLTPLGMIWNEDGYSWGTQWAAEQMPLPTGRGMTQRIAGTHTYAAVIPVRNKREIAARDKRVRANLPGFLDRFDLIWRQRRSEIEIGWQSLRARDVSALSDDELAVMLVEARRYYRRLFEIHFEMMYPLISNYLGFRGVCHELGIETATVARFLQGYETKISETDRALWQLAADARSGGVQMLFAATAPHELAGALQRDDAGRAWLSRLNDFLDVYGYRTAGTADVALPSWTEDPTPVLSTVAKFLRQDRPHDFDSAHATAVEERETAIDEARGRLTRREQQVFDAGLISVQHANFPWWQDDHNYYIDPSPSPNTGSHRYAGGPRRRGRHHGRANQCRLLCIRGSSADRGGSRGAQRRPGARNDGKPSQLLGFSARHRPHRGGTAVIRPTRRIRQPPGGSVVSAMDAGNRPGSARPHKALGAIG